MSAAPARRQPARPRLYRNKRVGGRFILKHRWVMEQLLGVALAPGTRVHHIDGCGANNDPSNLALMNGREHDIVHKTLPVPSAVCPVCGLLFFRYQLRWPSRSRTVPPTCSRSCALARRHAAAKGQVRSRAKR